MKFREHVPPTIKGLIYADLYLGVVSSINPQSIGVNLSEAGKPSGSFAYGGRYGRGEVNELVLIEGQQSLILGRITDVRLREVERRHISSDFSGTSDLDALGQIQLLGTVAMDDLAVSFGVAAYPRIGDRIYSAPSDFIALLPLLMDGFGRSSSAVLLRLGTIDASRRDVLSVKPERLFGRHCAILGATGGGKSWTTARIIEECIRYNAKLILIDATSEYRGFENTDFLHYHLGEPVERAAGSTSASVPSTSFDESDFVALFEPAGRVQGPKLRAAMKSLRLAAIMPHLASDGCIKKIGEIKEPIESAEKNPAIAGRLDNPAQPFDVLRLVDQIEQECVWPSPPNQPGSTRWGGRDDSSLSFCLPLITRINGILASSAFDCVFDVDNKPALTENIDAFLASSHSVMRICLSGIAEEYNAQGVIANAIGRFILAKARAGAFADRPLLILVDEAHRFLGRKIGMDEYTTKLDAFELIAKEGRKYGLNICLTTQRPRDITEGVLSQIGTLVVHRLTNDHDRAVVERACGEVDRIASAFLPNLSPGEALIVGTDFPIPLTVRISPPVVKPQSEGPNYQQHWAVLPQS